MVKIIAKRRFLSTFRDIPGIGWKPFSIKRKKAFFSEKALTAAKGLVQCVENNRHYFHFIRE